MNTAREFCLKNRIKTAMENGPAGNEQVHSVLTAAVALTNLGDKTVASSSSEDDDVGNARIFPQKLYDILSEESNAEFIGWLPHGKGFIIKNRKRFAAEVLPKYFKQTKYTSFTRKLNRWDFTRVTRGPELGAYYHKFFQKGNPTLCTQMYCKNERAKFAKATVASGLAPEVLPKVPAATQPATTKRALPPAAPQRQPIPKIHPSLLLSERAKMVLATQCLAQARAQQAAQTNFKTQCMASTDGSNSTSMSGPAPCTAAIVNAAARALWRSNALSIPQAKQIPQAPHQQPAAAPAVAMPKIPASQAALAQARMAQLAAMRRNGDGRKKPSYRASAA